MLQLQMLIHNNNNCEVGEVGFQGREMLSTLSLKTNKFSILNLFLDPKCKKLALQYIMQP